MYLCGWLNNAFSKNWTDLFSIQPCWPTSDSALPRAIWAQSGPKKLQQKAIPAYGRAHFSPRTKSALANWTVFALIFKGAKLDSKIGLYFIPWNGPIFRDKRIFQIYSVGMILIFFSKLTTLILNWRNLGQEEKCINYREGISLATYFYLNFRMVRNNFQEFGIICKGLNYLDDNRY